eukprot:gene34182-56908_t
MTPKVAPRNSCCWSEVMIQGVVRIGKLVLAATVVAWVCVGVLPTAVNA